MICGIIRGLREKMATADVRLAERISTPLFLKVSSNWVTDRSTCFIFLR
jgi:hypothetical protein